MDKKFTTKRPLGIREVKYSGPIKVADKQRILRVFEHQFASPAAQIRELIANSVDFYRQLDMDRYTPIEIDYQKANRVIYVKNRIFASTGLDLICFLRKGDSHKQYIKFQKLIGMFGLGFLSALHLITNGVVSISSFMTHPPDDWPVDTEKHPYQRISFVKYNKAYGLYVEPIAPDEETADYTMVTVQADKEPAVFDEMSSHALEYELRQQCSLIEYPIVLNGQWINHGLSELKPYPMDPNLNINTDLYINESQLEDAAKFMNFDVFNYPKAYTPTIAVNGIVLDKYLTPKTGDLQKYYSEGLFNYFHPCRTKEKNALVDEREVFFAIINQTADQPVVNMDISRTDILASQYHDITKAMYPGIVKFHLKFVEQCRKLGSSLFKKERYQLFAPIKQLMARKLLGSYDLRKKLYNCISKPEELSHDENQLYQHVMDIPFISLETLDDISSFFNKKNRLISIREMLDNTIILESKDEQHAVEVALTIRVEPEVSKKYLFWHTLRPGNYLLSYSQSDMMRSCITYSQTSRLYNIDMPQELEKAVDAGDLPKSVLLIDKPSDFEEIIDYSDAEDIFIEKVHNLFKLIQVDHFQVALIKHSDKKVVAQIAKQDDSIGINFNIHNFMVAKLVDNRSDHSPFFYYVLSAIVAHELAHTADYHIKKMLCSIHGSEYNRLNFTLLHLFLYNLDKEIVKSNDNSFQLECF